MTIGGMHYLLNRIIKVPIYRPRTFKYTLMFGGSFELQTLYNMQALGGEIRDIYAPTVGELMSTKEEMTMAREQAEEAFRREALADELKPVVATKH